MVTKKSKFKDAAPEVITENLFKENPDGLPDHTPHPSGIVLSTHVPQIRKINFINNRDPGYPLEFHYSSATHPLKHYVLYHGYNHELPEEVIEHLESCAENDYAYRKSVHGHPEMYVKGQRSLYQLRKPKPVAA